MKKFSKEYILLYLEIVFAGTFILLIIAYNISVKNSDYLDRGMYSENVAGIQLSSSYLTSVKGEKVDFDIENIDKTHDFSICKQLSEEADEIVRGIYQTKDIFHMSEYVKSGRYFEKSDFDGKTPVAVIGADMKDYTYEQNGKTYYGYEKQLYEVVGIFKETGKALDHAVYLNLGCLLDSEEKFGLYYIDSDAKGNVENVADSILSQAKGKYTANKVEYESPAEKTGLNFMNNTLLYCSVGAVLLNMIITVLFFIEHKRYKVAIQKLCGMTKKNLLVFYGKRMGMCFGIALFSIEVILKLCIGNMGFFFNPENISWKHHLIMFCFVIATFIITLAGVLRLTDRVDISASLKNR